MAEDVNDEPASPVRVVMTRGTDDEPDSVAMIYHGTVPLSVSRRRLTNNIVVSADAGEDGTDGFCIDLSEAVARQLVTDLQRALDDPGWAGVGYMEPDDA